MLNYFNFRKLSADYLITNDEGRYEFVDASILKKLVLGDIDPSSSRATHLLEKGFVYENREEFLKKQKQRIRRMKGHLFHCTSLHIFVLTNACNLQCVYCQARSGNESEYQYMDEETAERAVDFALQAPDEYLTFEFQGGEPLLNFGVIRHIVEYTEKHKKEKKVEYSLVSNMILLDGEKIQFIKDNHIGVSTSIDGGCGIHDSNRPFVDGAPSYAKVIQKLQKLRENGLCPGVIETTTRTTLGHAKELVETFTSLGFTSVFIRPLTPLGYADRNWNCIGYTPAEFLEFYKECLAHIIDLNMAGTSFQEGHASLFLKKILGGEDPNYMELRSPCGGMLGQVAYFFNGDIYTCDEGRMLGEMGNQSFRLGNVFNNTFDEVICSSPCKALLTASYLESLPECCDCAYQPYCGVCPVVNLAMHGDIFPVVPNDYKCQIYRGILDIIFEYLKDENGAATKVLKSWI